MKKSIVALSILALAIVAGATISYQATNASETQTEKPEYLCEGKRHGGPGFEKMLEAKSEILGVSEDELKAAHKNKTFHELVEASGMTQEEFHEQMKAYHLANAQERLNQLVADGEITQEQADEKLEWMQNNDKPMRGKGFGKGVHKGFKNFSSPE